MPVLDDNDPVVLLQNQILKTLDHQDSYTAIAALSLTLSLVLRRYLIANPDADKLRRDLMDLTVDTLRSRASEPRES